MPTLSKAVLEEIGSGRNAQAVGHRVEVQFNPTSLRLQTTNRSEGGEQAGRQARQYVGTGSTTLSLELVFDTADEGSTERPASVLERTAEVEYFVKPQDRGQEHQAPPRVRFRWGQLILDGVVEGFGLDLDHFAHDGTPLRAKVALSIRGQDPEYEFGSRGPAANAGLSAPPAAGVAGAGALPGALRAGLSAALDRAVGGPLAAFAAAGAAGDATLAQALDGESLPQLAARLGVDPAAWRALAVGGADPLRLEAGRQVGIGGGASVGGGLGATTGALAAAAPGTGERLGLQAAPAADATRAALQQGYRLAGAGGLGAALETARALEASTRSETARRAFADAAGPVQSAPAAAGMAVFSLRADPRATSFGRDVPLRPSAGGASSARANALDGQASARQAAPAGAPTTRDPTVPRWRALPASATPGPSAAARGPCGCGGGSPRETG